MRARSTVALGVGAYVAGSSATILHLSLATTALEFELAGGIAVRRLTTAVAVLLGAVASFAVVAIERDRSEIDVLERFRHARPAAFVLVPLGVCVPAALGVAITRGVTPVKPVVGTALVAFVGWRAIVRGARTRYARRALEEGATRLASLPPVDGRRVSRRLRLLNGAFGAFALVSAGVTLLLEEGSWYFYLAMSVAPLAIALESESDRPVSVTDRGLLLESRFGASLLEWSAFGGYYLGDELVLLRSERWRRDLTFEFDDEGPDQRALEVIDRHLPRSASPAVPAGGLPPDRDRDEASGTTDRALQ